MREKGNVNENSRQASSKNSTIWFTEFALSDQNIDEKYRVPALFSHPINDKK